MCPQVYAVLTICCVMQAAPAAVEAITKLTAFRGFAGTSVLIIVGVATDTARKVLRSAWHVMLHPACWSVMGSERSISAGRWQ